MNGTPACPAFSPDWRHSKRIRFQGVLTLIALLGLGVRGGLIDWHPGEYTDGIIQLTLLENENAYYPPLYAVAGKLIRLTGLDALRAGRLVSVAAAALMVWPIAALACLVVGKRGAIAAAVCWCTIPIANRWALHAMSDMLFTLWVAWAGVAFVRAWHAPQSAWPQRFLFLAGLAALTRVHGLVLLLGVGLLVARTRRRWSVGASLVALIPWVVLLGWYRVRGLQVGALETHRFDAPLGLLMQAFAVFGLGFLRWLPYGMGYLLALAVAAGALVVHRRCRVLAWLSAGLLAVWLLVHTWQLSFQLRYFLPLMPFACTCAAAGTLRIARVLPLRSLTAPLVVAAITGVGLTMSAGVIQFQRYSWAALAEAAAFVGTLPPTTRIFADEFYDPANPPNIKVRFFSKRNDILFCYESFSGSVRDLRRDLRPGDCVLLNSLSSNIPLRVAQLRTRFDVEQIFSAGHFLWPLLPDLMGEFPHLTNHPYCMRQIGVRQEYVAMVFLLKPRSGIGEEKELGEDAAP